MRLAVVKADRGLHCLCTERKISLSDLRRGRSSTVNRKPAEQLNPERERELMECFRNR